MTRLFCACLLAVICLVPATASNAGWGHFWRQVHADWHQSNAWPKPYSEADRHLTQAPFEAMVKNGWKMQNTLGAELFDSETQRLTRAGESKVHWILTQAPVNRRNVFVLNSPTEQATQTRLASVQLAVQRILGTQTVQESSVMVIHTPPRYGSGDYLNRVRRSYEASTPNPRLPASSSNASSGM